ncbi:Vacuolar protein 8 [Dimargaris verticillata]|uniref:Vacuolar protein 8 n=1 Tax=Dimargaris verticillata TaxID=2761393 RepID=A0A9W8B6Y8_9FUNG|nr:Vacuolar protein 8 [Dimargaris verticillata]
MGGCHSLCSPCRICCPTCFGFCDYSKQGYEALLQEGEREAVNDLIHFFEDRNNVNFYEGDALRALTTLAFSDNIDLQRSAALAFSEISEIDVRPIGRDALEPIMFLLQSQDSDVQCAASTAIGNLAVDPYNKLLIVQQGGVEQLVRLMMSPNVEAQCNAVGCITNLATHEENKSKIAKSGALIPLTRLARSNDIRVQRNATGALLNMTHSVENRQQLVTAGAIPVLVGLLSSPDADVQYYCTTALSNIAVDASSRKRLSSSEPKLVNSLIHLMDTASPKVQCQAALALRNLASDQYYQEAIVRSNGLPSLLRLLQSAMPPLIISAVACIRNISIHPDNEAPIIDANFLPPLIQLLTYRDNQEIQCHAISALRNLAASSDDNKKAIVDAGAVELIRDLVLDCSPVVQSEMTAVLAVLSLSEDLNERILQAGILPVLVQLTRQENPEVQGNSAAAIGNLAVRAPDLTWFVEVWEQPHGGIQGYLTEFLKPEQNIAFHHVAVWIVLHFLEQRDAQLTDLIVKHPTLLQSIRTLLANMAHRVPQAALGGIDGYRADGAAMDPFNQPFTGSPSTPSAGKLPAGMSGDNLAGEQGMYAGADEEDQEYADVMQLAQNVLRISENPAILDHGEPNGAAYNHSGESDHSAT